MQMLLEGVGQMASQFPRAQRDSFLFALERRDLKLFENFENHGDWATSGHLVPLLSLEQRRRRTSDGDECQILVGSKRNLSSPPQEPQRLAWSAPRSFRKQQQGVATRKKLGALLEQFQGLGVCYVAGTLDDLSNDEGLG